MNNILRLKDFSYSYKNNVIFENVNLAFNDSSFYAITGPSGSGKTTLLYVLAGLDTKYKGDLYFNQKIIKEDDLVSYRQKDVSIIFQNYNLLPWLNAIDNIMLASDISDSQIDKNEILKLLEEFGIKEKDAKRKVKELSGGEQQRVAIIRALASKSKIIIADEPSGNLDYDNGLMVINIFKELAHKYNKCIIMATHNNDFAKLCDYQLIIDRNKHSIDII